MWLVGAGYWGSKIASTLKKFNVDTSIIDIKNGQSINDINNQDPVILATPLWQHHTQTVELLKRGHDVYIEKPMATTTDEIDNIANVWNKKSLIMVGHIFIHHPQIAQIKDIIASGEIGDVVHISSQRANWGIYQTKTDPVLSLATHDISIVQELAGPIMGVTRVQEYVYTQNTQPDRVMFDGFVHGIRYDIDVTWCSPVRVRRTIIMGDQGQIVWDQDANTITVCKNIIENNRAVKDNNPVVHEYVSSLSPLEAELKHWVDCVQTRKQPTTGINEARSVAQTIDDVHKCMTSSI